MWKGSVLLVYVPTKENVADIFTKPMPIELSRYQRAVLLNEPDQGKYYHVHIVIAHKR
jgi:hypothetical protein